MAASEAVPYAKTGGLADVTGALPQELAKLGHDVILLLPKYRSVADSGRRFRSIARLPIATAEGTEESEIEEDVIQTGFGNSTVRVWTCRHDRFFDRSGLYQEHGADYPDNLNRFAWFSRAVIEVMAYLAGERAWQTDVLHVHDWQTALCAVYLKTVDRHRSEIQNVKTVLTLHNVGYQGIFPRIQFTGTGLPSGLFSPAGLEFYDSVNLLKGGIIFADRITTVSPSYAREILSPEFGFGLEGVLRNRQDQLYGILNGIDSERWNPATDPFLAANYSADEREGKGACKLALQREFSLPEIPVPVFAVIARLSSQKGLDLLEAIIPKFLSYDVQLIVLGTGDPAHETAFREAQKRYPDRMGLYIGFDERLAHRIEGGADIFIMPSRYEPCGLSQMYSLRYGTVPVVTKTGGLADTVIPFNQKAKSSPKANGFHLASATSESLLAALLEAAEVYRTKEIWNRVIDAGMRADVSWARSARFYEDLFLKLVGEEG